MLREPPVEDFVAGGYLLAKPYVPPADRDACLLPPDIVVPPVITVCPCLASLMPDGDLLGWTSPRPAPEFLRRAAWDWGTEPAHHDGFLAWADTAVREGRVRAGDAFVDLESARECLGLFGPPGQDVRVLGVGLRHVDRAAYLAALHAGPMVLSTGPALGDGGYDGLVEGLRSDLSLERGGRLLGYEVLDVRPGTSRHSWLCHGLEREMQRRFDLHPLPGGLIPTLAEAQRIATYFEEAAVGCEPGAWRAWAIVEYDALG